MDKLTPEQRRKNMQAVKSKGTKIEVIFGKMLWNAGVRYRKNDKQVFGHPDFTLRTARIAIFCDGEFWHGKNWELRKLDHKSHQEFWIPKIERNMQRDCEVNEYLRKEGWTILRFWETDIKKHPDECINEVLRTMKQKDKEAADKIALTQMCNGGNVKMQFFGPHSLNEDGRIMPFNEQMAI